MTRLTRPEIMRRLVRALVALAVCLAFGSDTDSGRTYTSSHATLRSGGGSVIIARGEAKKQGSDITVPTDLHATKGGSYIIGRKLDGEWEPGELIERPAAFSEAKHTFIQLGNGRTLKLSYRCATPSRACCYASGGRGNSWVHQRAATPYASRRVAVAVRCRSKAERPARRTRQIKIAMFAWSALETTRN